MTESIEIGPGSLDDMERRHLTVMFVDLAGSTQFSHEMDAEDYANLILRYQEIVADKLRECGTRITRIIGDGMLVLLGWPIAHEDDAARAIRAAISIHAALKDASTFAPHLVRCRIGIATGLVVVGDINAMGVNQSDAVFGQTPNLASRLQNAVAPGETAVSEATRLLVGNAFVFESMGWQTLKGFENAIEVFRLRGETDGGWLSARRHARGNFPLVGRQLQLEALLQEWNLARSGTGRVVSICGEAGIGKTRLLQAHRAHPDLGPHTTFVYYCSPLPTNTAFHPFIDRIERWCGIRRDDNEPERQEKLAEYAGPFLTTKELSLLAAVVDPSPQGNRLLSNMSQQAFREALHNILLKLIRGFSNEAPVLIHFEDVHWIDPSSKWMLECLARSVHDMPILLAISHRDLDELDFLTDVPIQRISLEALQPDEAQVLAQLAVGDRSLGDERVTTIIERANGVPLYIEELAAALAADDGNSAGGEIPETLKDLLAERLDLLGDDRSTALAAAVLGGEFNTSFLAAVADVSRQDARAAAKRLVHAGVLRVTNTMQDETFAFRHVLLQEAAEQCLIADRRLSLHHRAANALEALDPTIVNRSPEIVALHRQKAGESEKAVASWQSAARLAIRRFAYLEASFHVAEGLSLMSLVEEGRRDLAELGLRLLESDAHQAINGYGAPETIAALKRSLELADRLGDHRAFLKANSGLFSAYQSRAEYDEAKECAERARSRLKETPGVAIADHMLGMTLIWQGKFRLAEATLNSALANIEPEGSSRFADALRSQILASVCVLQAFRGQGERAKETAELSISIATALDKPLLKANAMLMACNSLQIIRDPLAFESANALLKFANQQKMPFYVSGARSFIAAALVSEGAAEKGLRNLKASWSAYESTKSRANQVFVFAEIARGCLLTGLRDDGLSTIAKGISFAKKTGERNFEAELYRLRSELLVDDDPVEAMAALEKALQIARDQGAVIFEIRTATQIVKTSEHAANGVVGRLKTLLDQLPTGSSMRDIVKAREVLASFSA